MKHKKFTINLFLIDLIDVIENHQPSLSYKFCLLCQFLHFFQILSYLLKSDELAYWEPKLSFLTNIVFYSNFINFLSFFKSDTLTYAIFYAIQTLIYANFIIFSAILIFKRIFKLSKLNKNRVLLSFYKLIVIFINLFLWVLMIPLLELYSNISNCDKFGRYFADTTLCSSIALQTLSIIALIIFSILSFLLIWLNRSHSFQEKCYLRVKSNSMEFIINFLKILLICFFQYINATIPILLHLIILFIGCFYLYNILYSAAISNQHQNECFLSFLIIFIIFSLGFLFIDHTTVLIQKNLFYILCISLAFSLKMGYKLKEKYNRHLYNTNFNDSRYIGVSLDNLYDLFENKLNNENSSFFFNGLLRNHYECCKLTDCVITKRKFEDFFRENALEQSRLINGFISETLIRALKDKTIRKTFDFEPLLLKYGSFITHRNLNAIKAIYELEHVFSMNQTPSFYFKCVSKNLHKNLQFSIIEYERISKLMLDGKEIDVATFAAVNKIKCKLQKEFLGILKIRLEFWEKLRDGFQSYDEMISSVNNLNDKILSMITYLDENIKNSKQNLLQLMLPLKFRSILSCVILNHLNEGVRAEDELDKLRKRETYLQKDLLNSTSFFENDVILIQASFLAKDGNMLESSKNEKLAEFFNYTLEETKAIKHITQFMPKLLRGFHQKLVDWYINKPRTLKSIEKTSFITYGVEKNGALFPIKLHTGHCFDYKNDFVFQTAVLKTKEEYQGFLFDKNGELHGFSKLFMEGIFGDCKEIVHISDFCLLNIFNLMPNLKDILEKNKGFSEISLVKLRNLNSYFYLPNNITEIIEILKTKAKEEETFRSHKSAGSNKSIKSEHISGSFKRNATNTKELSSSKNNSKFISKFFKTTNISSDYKSVIQRRYLENNLTNYDILKELIDKHNCKKIKFNFDLIFFNHPYSESESLQYASFLVQKLAFITNTSRIPGSSENFTSEQLSGFDNIGDPTLIQNSDIPSNFINMPIPMVPEFRESILSPLSPMSSERKKPMDPGHDNNMITEGNAGITDNMLFTTEGDQQQQLINNKINDRMEDISLFNKKNAENVKSGINNNKENLMTAPKDLYPMISLNEISSNQEKKEEENSYDSGFNSSQSKEKRARIQLEVVKGKTKTSNEKIYDFQDISSQNSSMSSLKKTFAIFNMMKLIQNNFPSLLNTLIFTRTIEVILIVIYCIVLLTLSREYIYSYYVPLEAAIVNFANLYNNYALSTLIMIEMQLYQANLTYLDENTNYRKIFSNDLRNNLVNFKEIINEERNKLNLHSYQTYFKSSDINVTHQVLPIFVQIPFLQFLDDIILLTNEVKSLNDQEADTMKEEYFITNFLVLQDKILTIMDMVWHEFDSTNKRILTSIEIVLILFILSVLLIKVFDFYKMEKFYQSLVKMLNILLRANQNETVTEIITTTETIKTIKNSFDEFLTLNFAEKLINRKTVKVIDEDVNNINRKNVNKTEKSTKIHRNNKTSTRRSYMKPVSRWPRFIFLFFSYILMFCFYFFNYFYWNIVNNEITYLIDTTNFFQNVYTLPSQICVSKNLIYRDKLMKNHFALQLDQQLRIQEIYQLLTDFTIEIKQNNMLIPNYALPAEDEINDQKFTNLVGGDICQVLMNESLIMSLEVSYCESVYNGAFQNGFITVSNEFANIKDYYENSLNPRNYKKSDLQEIKDLFKGDSIDMDITALGFINSAMQLFYDTMENYHKNAMFQQQNYLQVMIVITTVFIGGGFLIIMYVYWRYLKKLYKNVSFVLSLIPYDRLMNDEQTVFLIKRFWKA